MSNSSPPTVTKWPFYLFSAALFALGIFIAQRHAHSLSALEISTAILAAVAGAVLGVVPFVLEYQTAVKLAGNDRLADAVSQIVKLEKLAAQISDATARWHDVQAAAGKTAASATEISERMANEVAQFTEFMQKANDTEKTALRLEVDKAHRAEGEWLQIVVRLLDHVFVLHQSAVASKRTDVIEQLTQFQNACREVTRRVGLAPFAAAPGEAFDAERHAVPGAEPAPAGAPIADTLATGYTYQGRLLRPALVRLQTAVAENSDAAPAAEGSEPTLL